MIGRASPAAGLLGIVPLLAASMPGASARAEGFLDLRAGGAFTRDGDVAFSALGFTIGGSAEFESSVTRGVRAGYWFDSLVLFVSVFAPR